MDSVQRPSDFPNTVGSYWIYETVDDVRGVTDTFMLAVSAEVDLPVPGSSAGYRVCDAREASMGNNCEVYVVSTVHGKQADTVKFYKWPEGIFMPYLRAIMVFPLERGTGWQMHEANGMFDSTSVESRGNVITRAGHFTDAAYLKQVYNCGDECGGIYEFWFKEGIGVVRSHRREHDIMDFPDGPQLIETWELIDYHIE